MLGNTLAWYSAITLSAMASPSMAFASNSTGTSSGKNVSAEYRPSIHFSPDVGFMNDPNGLIYDSAAGKYHMYFQLNPNGTIAGNTHWGHATSPDLLHWEDQPVAINPTQNGELAFTGTVVNDVNNTSKLFPTRGSQNFVAIFTRASDTAQFQVMMFSLDGGKSYQEYPHNPVLNLNSSSFRDPQVQWIAKHNKWVMTIAKSREHQISFYESQDLRSWKKLSDFRSGVLGVDYECPNLVPVLDENNATKYVLFVSVNPGMPQGGSGTQYFVGDFDGVDFVPDQEQASVVQFVDFGKDNYALQYINPGAQSFNASSNSSISTLSESSYIGWFGNWQYCQETPTKTWRSAMTLARQLSVKKDWLGISHLVQTPRNIESIRSGSPKVTNFSASTSKPSPILSLGNGTSAVEITVNAKFPNSSASPAPGTSRVYLDIFNSKNESLQIGFDKVTSQVWIDRGSTRGFKNPFFTDKFSAALKEPTSEFEWKIILDSSLLEFYTEGGFTVASVTYYPTSPLDKVQLSLPNGGSVQASISVQPLEKTMNRQTLN